MAIKRQLACFTIVKDEPYFMPLWMRHYAKQLGSTRDLFILDHDTSAPGPKAYLEAVRETTEANIVPVHRDESFDTRWLRAVVQDLQRLLLQSYDMVLFAESDEMIFADPDEYKTLAEYVDVVSKDMEWGYIRTHGYEVVHDVRAGEPPVKWKSVMDDGTPVMANRKKWAWTNLYCKPLLTRDPINYHLGFHDADNLPAPIDPSAPQLHLLHLHQVDFPYCVAKHQANVARKWAKWDLDHGTSFQNRIADAPEVLKWFERPELKLEEIPTKWRNAI